MARANNGGWGFVKEGEIFQYKEEGCVAMVNVLKDNSDKEKYSFEIKILASNGGFDPGVIFTVSHTKNPGGYWNEMTQFYETAEYIPLPLGKSWPKSLPGYETIGLEKYRIKED